MSSPADSSVQNLLPVQAYFDVEGNFVTFIGQNKPFTATIDPDQSGLHITDSTIDSSVIGGTTPAAGTFTSLATTTGTIATAAVNPTDIVNKQYVDYFAAGLSWKEPVLTATSLNITLSGTQTINGVALVAGDTVLVKDQSTASENGIYTVAAGAWSRSVGADTWDEYIGAIVFIVEGSLAGTAWYCTAQPGGTLGTTAINWSNFSVASSYTAGTGLQLIGTQFSIANTAVTAGSYGTASKTPSFTVNAQGQLTAASQQDIAIAYTQVSGLGTMAVQNANAVNITGGSISGITDLAVADGGTGASTASGARTNLGAAASGANSDITSMTGITGGISSPDYIAFDTTYSTALTAGQLGWDGNNTLGLGMAGGNVTQHIGEDQFFYYKASSAVTKGQVVMFTGAVGASGVPTGAPATGITDGTYIMGVAAEDVALNDFGLVQAFGTLRNVNTTGYSDGDILWYNPAVTGGLTKTKPSAPNVKVQMAAVINGGSSGGGTILIRIEPGSVLGGTDSNVQFGTLASGDVVQYNGTYWTNVAIGSAIGTLGVANGGTGLTSLTAGSMVYGAGTSAFSTLAIGTNGYILKSNGSAPTWVDPATVVGGAGGSNTQVQYNSSGALAGSSNLTFDGTNLTVGGYATATSFRPSSSTVPTNGLYLPTTNTLGFATNTTEQMRLDASGNLGLGVTPSAWNSNFRAIDIFNAGSGISAAYSSGYVYTYSNCYQNGSGNWVYAGTAAASRFTAKNNGYTWDLAPSGTAGNAITFTQAMTLDASGNLGIGTSSPASFGAGYTNTQINGSTGSFLSLAVNGTRTGYMYADASGVEAGSLTNTYYRFLTNSAERMRIDSSGNVGIGVTNPATKLCIASDNAISFGTSNYCYINGSTATNALSFGTQATERMRISSTGGLSVGTTADPGAGAIYATGNITAYYSSDRNLKENIKDVEGALTIVSQIGSKTFDWTDEYIASKGGEDGYFVQKSDFGVIAQDVQEVFPQAVRTREDGTLAVDYEKLSTLAFGAIKELVKRVEALEAR